MSTITRQKSFSSVASNPLRRQCIFFFVTFVLVLILLQIQAFNNPLPAFSSPSSWQSFSFLRQAEIIKFTESSANTTNYGCSTECNKKLDAATSRLRDMVEFLPLKDLRFARTAMEGHTWFMSSLNDTLEANMSQYLHFPSQASGGRLLCLAGNSRSNGTVNSYALAWPDSLPRGARLLGGLTFVSDTYYDYDNIWHGLSALVPMLGWHRWKGCAVPARLVMYHWGEIRSNMATWVRTIMEATFGRRVPVELFDDGAGDRATCFEEAVVFRHNEGAMSKANRGMLYDMVRCKARALCNITDYEPKSLLPEVRATLFLRTGTRAFKNESAVVEFFKRECGKVRGCRVTVARPNNLTFCDQVRVMSDTDVLVSQHGAQLTNMIFMDRNSSVMEFFPRGWLELAGVGQYVYHWLSDWAGMRHQGTWRDKTEEADSEGGVGDRCPFPAKDPRCFGYYKDQKIGHNETYLANWAREVLGKVRVHKLREVAEGITKASGSNACSCSRRKG